MNDYDNLIRYCAHVQTRWATAENPHGEPGGACRPANGAQDTAAVLAASRKAHPCLSPLRAGQTAVLADATAASGIVRRIWITIGDRTPEMLRSLRLDMFWDGAATPAVSVPLGDFFGHGTARMTTFQNALFGSPEGRSFNAWVPMPFRTGMRIQVTNESGKDLSMLYYEVDYTLGDRIEADALYFHAHWRRESPTTPLRDFEIMPRLGGHGRFLGVTLGVMADTAGFLKTWWGEGEVKVYLDGDSVHPTLCGTGTEDYIGTGWGQGAYATPFQGCPLADHEKHRYGFYRLHIPDPVFFHREIRVTIQQIGCWGPDTIAQLHGLGVRLTLGGKPVDMAAAVGAKGYGLFERHDDWSSCAYFYLDRPENGLPALAPVAARVAGVA